MYSTVRRLLAERTAHIEQLDIRGKLNKRRNNSCFDIDIWCFIETSLMGDYRYTELSYKITSLISRTCCLGSSGLTYT